SLGVMPSAIFSHVASTLGASSAASAAATGRSGWFGMLKDSNPKPMTASKTLSHEIGSKNDGSLCIYLCASCRSDAFNYLFQRHAGKAQFIKSQPRLTEILFQ